MHRYKLLERIGNGGYSQVFKTLDQKTGCLCALKVMKQSYDRCKTVQDMELSTLKTFSHSVGIVRLLDHFVEDGFLILAFELMQMTLIDFYKKLRIEESRNLIES
jgi:serine/threonine protein kinase